MEDGQNYLEDSDRTWYEILNRIKKAVYNGVGIRLSFEECVTIHLGFDDPDFDSDREQN